MDTVNDSTGTRMASSWVIFLSIYLLIASLLSVYVVYSLWSAQAPTADGPAPVPSCPAPPPVTPTLIRLFPPSVSAGSAADVLVLGCGFTTATQVSFNGAPRPSLLMDASHIRVSLASADVSAPADILITVSHGGAAVGSLGLTVVPATVSWHLFGLGPWRPTPEVQLLLMVLFIGAFGSCIYALKSLADYRGDNKLFDSWFLFYTIQPFEGAGAALLLYLVIRGGFLGGTSADVKTANQFGMCAIAGLAGAFSDIAFIKLREVFLTLFKPKDDRGGKLGPRISTTSLADGIVGTPYKQDLQASGGTAPLKWSVNPPLPAGLNLESATGTISGTPTAVSPKTNYKFTVTDSAPAALSATLEIPLEIKAASQAPSSGPKITTASLPPGTVGTLYTESLKGSGGTAPLKWSVNPPLPASLNLDANTGFIDGTPTGASAKKIYKFTVTDSATPSLSTSTDLTLEIK